MHYARCPWCDHFVYLSPEPFLTYSPASGSGDDAQVGTKSVMCVRPKWKRVRAKKRRKLQKQKGNFFFGMWEHVEPTGIVCCVRMDNVCSQDQNQASLEHTIVGLFKDGYSRSMSISKLGLCSLRGRTQMHESRLAPCKDHSIQVVWRKALNCIGGSNEHKIDGRASCSCLLPLSCFQSPLMFTPVTSAVFKCNTVSFQTQNGDGTLNYFTPASVCTVRPCYSSVYNNELNLVFPPVQVKNCVLSFEF
jgi:hypothetical protein